MVAQTPLALSQVIDKLNWADEHIKKLAASINTYTRSKPYTRVLKEESDTLGNLYEFTAFTPPSVEISLILGDVAHNLRSCLNYLACALMRTLIVKSKCDKLAYPIAPSANEFYTTLCNAHMDLAGDKVVKFLERHQPYVTGYESLAILNRVNNTDKHRFLVVAVTAMTAAIVRDIKRVGKQEAIPEFARETLIAPLVKPLTLKVGATYRVRPVPNYELNKNANPAISVHFGEKGILEGENVDLALEDCGAVVRTIVENSYVFFP